MDDIDDTEETVWNSDDWLSFLRLMFEGCCAAGSNNGEPDTELLRLEKSCS